MKVAPGVLCRVIGGTDNLNIGKIVKVDRWAGEHTEFGNIWTATCTDGDIVTEYGGVTPDADFAQDWLEPLPPEAPKTKVEDRELEKT